MDGTVLDSCADAVSWSGMGRLCAEREIEADGAILMCDPG